MADSLVEAFYAQEASVQAEPVRLFKPGERRVMVLIELFSKQVRVRVGPANLRKVS